MEEEKREKGKEIKKGKLDGKGKERKEKGEEG